LQAVFAAPHVEKQKKTLQNPENVTGAACGLTFATVSPQAAAVIVCVCCPEKKRKNDIFFSGAPV